MAYDVPAIQDVGADQESQGWAGADKQDLDFIKFDQYMVELRDQPGFRVEQDKCCDYYDNNQLDTGTLQTLQDRGLAPLIENLVKPTVDTVLGMEAKTRSDWRVQADGDEYQDVAEALSTKLHEAVREARADRARSDAYASQIKAGLGWVEVSRQSDPFKYPYRVAAVHRREIFWDWLAREPDLSDARYQIRKRWFDRENLKTFLPQHAGLIDAVGAGWGRQWIERATQNLQLAQALDIERAWSLEDYEWRDIGRSRVMLFEVTYRVYCRGYVFKLADGRTIELDMRNPLHMAALASGKMQPKPAVYSKLRQSLWLGPHKLVDRDRKSRSFKYVPFWGNREDTTNVPYGLIRTMISPQDEINARKQKLMWMLSARRLRIDSDALDPKVNTITDVLAELSRPDAAIVLNPARLNKQGAIEIDENLGMAAEQFKIYQASKEALQQAAGVYQAMLGDAKGGATSGIAINSLVEQGSITLAEINDNYRYAQHQVGALMLELIREDMTGQQVDVIVGEDPRKKTISLNTPSVHPETQMQVLANDVERSKVKVALEDVPSTPAYRGQVLQMLTEVMKGLDPQMQGLLTPFYIEATELPKRKELAELIRKKMGIAATDPRTMTDAEKQQEQQAMQEAQQMKMLQFKAMEADVEAKIAMVQKIRAEAMKIEAETQGMGAGNPEADQARAAMADQLKAAEEVAQKQISGLTQQLAKVRDSKDQEILKLTLAMQNEDSRASAEIRRAEIDRETKIAVATLEAERDRVMATVQAQMKDMKAGFEKKLAALAAKAKPAAKPKAKAAA